jgi:hypothetical protein
MIRKGITELVVDVFGDVFVSDDDFGVLCLSKKYQPLGCSALKLPEDERP